MTHSRVFAGLHRFEMIPIEAALPGRGRPRTTPHTADRSSSWDERTNER